MSQLCFLLCVFSAYGSEDELNLDKADEEEQMQDDGLSLDGQDADYLFNDEEDRDHFSCQNSPLSNGTNPDAGYASPLSSTSDQMGDLKSTPSFSDQEKEKLGEKTELVNGMSLQDSLEKMKSVYANLISDASWSSIALDMLKSTSNVTTYDWHQAALAKTLQHNPYHLLPEPSLFSTVQLYRQNNKLYGPVFTGASKFRCKDCSGAYDTLVGLTVHMNETGHYRDDNKDPEDDRSKKWSKPRKRSLLEMEGKEDAQKVLKCMYCGHSFESLQDLSVHMIKTKHYQKVPLKEPMPALTSNSPESVASSIAMGESPKDQKVSNPYVTPNNRYGYQNGASYTWQFEARKAQILKCMECGSSHDTLQQLTAHMMVTGHFLKVTNTASKKGKQLVFDPVVEEKIQSIPLPPTTTRLPAPNGKSPPDSPMQPTSPEEQMDELKEEEEKIEMKDTEKNIKEEKDDVTEKEDKPEKVKPYEYLTEKDLEEAPKGGLDILKSLENTVSSAISKAQTGTPTWGGYPSIHAAYQLHGSIKSTIPSSAQVHPLFSNNSLKLSADLGKLMQTSNSPSPPPSQKSNVLAMEELVEKVTGKSSVKTEREEKAVDKHNRSTKSPLTASKDTRGTPSPENLSRAATKTDNKIKCKEDDHTESKPDAHIKTEVTSPKRSLSNGCSNLSIITDHSPEPPAVNPLSALQSVMNNHLGKASQVNKPFVDPFATLYKLNNSPAQIKQVEPVRQYAEDDQPIDLTKSKSTNGCSTKSTSATLNNSKPIFKTFSQSQSPLRENALMDISDMVKNLTGRLTPKSTPSSISEKSDIDGCTFEESLEELSPIQRRKGRHLKETPEGKFVINDLGPQERVHICKFTGLSMTTISHWLANVKYQLKRTGGTKFLKNIDSGQPLFLCSDCASQFRTPSSYIHHLESHLGFTLKDLSKLSIDLIEQQVNRIEDKTSGLTEDDTGSVHQCKLCNRTFVSKHAIKLHLCKTHAKSPEDHLVFVKEMEKLS
uniref:Teashirt zinc finger homeobox 1 n=1 Tax=Neogobius melanostomus TaxID=47308 RepID=A0A8C6SBR5_9GOBI